MNEVEPEQNGGPRRDQTRVTASATYHRPLRGQGSWATTAMWGRNEEDDRATNAFLVETSVNLAERNVLFFRGETARKTGEDLVRQPTPRPRRPCSGR